ncbi:hypothetical protein F5Y13DRAFT_130432 [Hypoxylon sp. FL1857]|nr:hypothetical protein F5Y13DRAFT_130432 [Hypoxylon sp. FL1857]
METAMCPINSFTTTGHFQPGHLDTPNHPGQVRRGLTINDLIEDPTMPSLGPNGPSYGPVAIPNPRPPNPKPKPKPQPAPAPAHSRCILQSRPTPLYPFPGRTIHDKTSYFPPYGKDVDKTVSPHLLAERPKFEEAIRAVVAREFQLPTTSCVRLRFRMSPADMDDQGRWYHGRGRIYRATGGFGSLGGAVAGIAVPTILFWMPERQLPSHRARALCDLGGPSPEDLQYQAAADRVVEALRSGAWLNQDRDWNPRAASWWLAGMRDYAFEFRDGLTDLAHVVSPGTFVYLPLLDEDGIYSMYSLIAQDGSGGAKDYLRKWAASFGVQLDL